MIQWVRFTPSVLSTPSGAIHENPGTIGLIRRSRQSLLSTGLRLPGSGCRFGARMMSIVPSHGLCNLLRGELAGVAGV